MPHECPEENGVRILSLDGGDALCLSQLFMIREYMHRIQVDSGETVRPCDHFHSITAVGAAGAIAVFLGMLGMTVEQAIDAFGRACKQVFPLKDVGPLERSSLLEDALKEILKSHGIPETARMRDASVSGITCKVSIGYLPSTLITDWRSFRNYESRQWSENPTIIEAIRAAWASPGSFAPVTISSVASTKALISAEVAFRNPTWQAIKEAVDAFGSERSISFILSLGSGVIGMNSSSKVQLGQQKGEADAEELEHRLHSTSIYFRLSVDRGLEQGIDVSDQVFGSIEEYTTSYLRRVAVTRTLDACISASQNKSAFAIGSINHITGRPKPTVAGLPPLSPFYVERREPMGRIRNALLEDPAETQQRLCIISGLGGSGKTQLAIKFAKENSDRFQHILFIDAFSEESITNGLIKRLLAIDSHFKGTTLDDALEALSQPNEQMTTNWCIILDNLDDIRLDPSIFLPQCDHGTFLITTRNEKLLEVSDEQHVRLDIMTPTEAVDTLLSAAFPSSSSNASREQPTQITSNHREKAWSISRELGFLPIAIVQAGCYIKHQKCLDDYLDRLKHSRQRVLTHPTRQITKLKYSHTAYDAFDTTLPILSTRARSFLAIMSFFHHTDFPRRLISLSASCGFANEMFSFAERDEAFRDAVGLLKDIFVPRGEWNEMDLDDLLDELQTYSMVALVHLHGEIVFRFHPLLHAWAFDRLTSDNHSILKLAAFRILCSGWDRQDDDINSLIPLHLNGFLPNASNLNLNDQATLLCIQSHSGVNTVDSWAHIHQTLQSQCGSDDIRTSDAALHLAGAYGVADQIGKKEQMEREQYTLRVSLFGAESLEAMKAASNLSDTLVDHLEQYSEGEQLSRLVLSVRRQKLTPPHGDIVDALRQLGTALSELDRHADAATCFEEGVAMSTLLFGQSHSRTIALMEHLARCYRKQEDARSEAIAQEILTLCQSRSSRTAVRAIGIMADIYEERRQFGEAEKLRRDQLRKMKELYGDGHRKVLHILFQLGTLSTLQNNFASAEPVWLEVIEKEERLYGKDYPTYLMALYWHAHTVYEQHRHGEAEKTWVEVLDRWRETGRKQEMLCVLIQLYRCLMEQDRYHEVEPLVREELAISHELNGEQSEKTAEILGRLATVVLSLGRIAEAEALRSEQYATRRKLLGDDDPDTIQALHQLTALFLTQERYAEAEALCKKELAVRPSPSEDDTSLVVLGCLSRCLYEQEKYEEAERYEREAIAASRMLYGDHHPKTLPYLRNLVLSVFCQDRYDESEALWLEIHALNEENYGPDGEATLESLHWLARSTYLQGRYAEAGELFSKELELWKDKGETRAESLKCLSWLARSLSKQQEQVGKAEALWKEEITAIRQGADGCDKEMLCTALHWYASFLAGDGRRQDEAIAVMREELELTRELEQVVEHPMKTLKVLEYLADFLFDEERYAEAVSVWEEVVSVSQAVYDSSTHALTLRARDCLARSKLEIKCYSEAEAIWRRCLSDMPENQHHVEEEEGSPSAKRRRLDFCHWLALSVFYQDRFDEAEALWREELAGRQAKSTQEEDEDKATSSALARCLHWIGYLFFVQQRYGEAEPFWRDEVEKRQKLNNGDGQQRLNPKTLDAKSWLARCLGHLVGKQMEAKAIWEEVIGGWKELENVEKVAEAEVELQKVVGAGM